MKETTQIIEAATVKIVEQTLEKVVEKPAAAEPDRNGAYEI